MKMQRKKNTSQRICNEKSFVAPNRQKTYHKPSITDIPISIEDPIASSGDDIYNVREIFK